MARRVHGRQRLSSKPLSRIFIQRPVNQPFQGAKCSWAPTRGRLTIARQKPGRDNDKKGAEKLPNLLSEHYKERHGDRGICTDEPPRHNQIQGVLPHP
jgi:hypothetical protein